MNVATSLKQEYYMSPLNEQVANYHRWCSDGLMRVLEADFEVDPDLNEVRGARALCLISLPACWAKYSFEF
jgi:hypothetical protein